MLAKTWVLCSELQGSALPEHGEIGQIVAHLTNVFTNFEEGGITRSAQSIVNLPAEIWGTYPLFPEEWCGENINFWGAQWYKMA